MRIPLYKVFVDDDDIEAVKRVTERGSYWTMGPEIEEFENKLAHYLGTKYAVVFNSGTSALYALMAALNLRSSDEVIVPSFTFIATPNSVLFVGAKPIFTDIEEERYSLDPEKVIKNITTRTKAILIVHYGGLPARVKEIEEIAEERNLLLIEDAAEALGALTEEGKKVGTYGYAGVLSFCGNKIITTGEGGAVVTNDEDLYERLKLIRSHGRIEKGPWFESAKGFDYVILGYNWRMPSINAALGISQLNKIEKIIKMRREKAKYYTKRINEEFPDIILPFEEPPRTRAVFQMYTIRLPWDNGKARDTIITELRKHGITTKVYFEPVHKYTLYRNLGYNYDLPKTELISKQVITLPLYPHMPISEIDYIIDILKRILKNIYYSK